MTALRLEDFGKAATLSALAQLGDFMEVCARIALRQSANVNPAVGPAAGGVPLVIIRRRCPSAGASGLARVAAGVGGDTAAVLWKPFGRWMQRSVTAAAGAGAGAGAMRADPIRYPLRS